MRKWSYPDAAHLLGELELCQQRAGALGLDVAAALLEQAKRQVLTALAEREERRARIRMGRRAARFSNVIPFPEHKKVPEHDREQAPNLAPAG